MSEASLLQLDSCDGRIRWRDHEIPIVFSLTCEADGRLIIAPAPIPVSHGTRFLFELDPGNARTRPLFTIQGTGPEGVAIQTDHAELTKCAIRSDQEGEFFDLESSSRLLDLSWPDGEPGEAPDSVRFDYFIPGLECFRPASADAAFGRVTVSGALSSKDYERITGAVSVELSHEHLHLGAEEVDLTVRLALDVLSLALGRFMHWSVRQGLTGGTRRSMRFLGPKQTTDPQFPLFSHLNLDPILNLGLKKYTRELCDATGADLAIQWFLMNPRYSELRFVTGMTALEHMIHVFSRNSPQNGLLPKDLFKEVVRPRLKSGLEAALDAIGDQGDWAMQREAMSAKLGSLNERPFRTNLETMLQHYDVPLHGIGEHIPYLVRLRNRIIHIGHQQKDAEQGLDFHNAVLRELLVRIFLTLLGYEGTYQSFLEGHPQWLVFPQPA